MKIGRVSIILSFLNKIISFFSFIHRHQKLVVLFPKSTFDIKHAYVLVLFLALSLFMILKGSSKASSDRKESHSHSTSSLAILELYPSYQVEDEMLDKTYDLANVVVKCDQEILDKTCSLTNIVVEDDQEFVPQLVHLELIEGATGSHEDYKDFIPRFVDVKLIKGVIDSDCEIEEFHGYDGYDEDNDDEGGDDDVDSTTNDGNDDDDDLNYRVEEFIAKTISKWKEEMLNDKLLYLKY